MSKYIDAHREKVINDLNKCVESQALVISQQALKNNEMLSHIEILEERIDHFTVYVDWIRDSYHKEVESKIERQKVQYEIKIKDILSQKEVKTEDLNKSPFEA